MVCASTVSIQVVQPFILMGFNEILSHFGGVLRLNSRPFGSGWAWDFQVDDVVKDRATVRQVGLQPTTLSREP